MSWNPMFLGFFSHSIFNFNKNFCGACPLIDFYESNQKKKKSILGNKIIPLTNTMDKDLVGWTILFHILSINFYTFLYYKILLNYGIKVFSIVKLQCYTHVIVL